ncbi:MAG TPA: hypothetical protein VJN69_01785 [Candidatus Acidoferrales bacterium]|nr:hypothetical protein [Candidatus Acidoferrales bacterium]
MKLLGAAIAICGVLLCCGANMQAQGAISASGPIVIIPPALRTVVGEPYSATFEEEMSQILADGTHIERHTLTQKQYRDSQGRTRTEEYIVDPAILNADLKIPSSITIRDPAARATFVLNPRERTARQLLPPKRPDLAPISPQAAEVRRQAEALRPHIEREDLGAQTIDGLYATGMRSTAIIPIGAQGNDGPIAVVTEIWASPDLAINVLVKTSDPRGGDHTIRLTNIDRSEPEPSLFEIPADYTIVQPQ